MMKINYAINRIYFENIVITWPKLWIILKTRLSYDPKIVIELRQTPKLRKRIFVRLLSDEQVDKLEANAQEQWARCRVNTLPWRDTIFSTHRVPRFACALYRRRFKTWSNGKISRDWRNIFNINRGTKVPLFYDFHGFSGLKLISGLTSGEFAVISVFDRSGRFYLIRLFSDQT